MQLNQEQLKVKVKELKELITNANKLISELTENCLYITIKQPTGRFLKIDVLKSF